jgi:hypothetical protein
MQHFRLHRLIGKEFVQIIVILLFWLAWPYEQLHDYLSAGAPRGKRDRTPRASRALGEGGIGFGAWNFCYHRFLRVLFYKI